MADGTKIEWTDATVNFWWGCTKVGPGCDHCYAETWSKRTGESIWGPGVPRRKIKSAVSLLYKLHNGYSWWAADHAIAGISLKARRRVFVQSMSDLFDKEVPAEWFDEAWATISACDRLEIQIVTKRISIVEKRLAGRPWAKHAGLIISVTDQDEADRDIPRLIDLKARLGIPWIGLSMEPLLGAIALRPEWLAALDWIIVGGESGPGARPMHPDWARSIRDQCATAGVPFLFKQWGEWGDDAGPPAQGHDAIMEGRVACAVRVGDAWQYFRDGYGPPIELCSGHGEFVYRLGKKRAGRLLDGAQHDGYPA